MYDDHQLSMLMFPVITRSPMDSWKAFAYAGGVAQPTWSGRDRVLNRVGGALFMWLAQGKIKKKYAIVDEEAELRVALHQWAEEGLAGEVVGEEEEEAAAGPFAGARATPSLADVAVFGSIREFSFLFKSVMRLNTPLI